MRLREKEEAVIMIEGENAERERLQRRRRARSFIRSD